jgi:hypothetical protein
MRVSEVLLRVKMISATSTRSSQQFLLSLACALAPGLLLLGSAATGQARGRLALADPHALPSNASLGVGAQAALGVAGEAPIASATLEQCVTAVTQSERSVTFSGEMTAIPGSVRMAMRIDVQQQPPGDALFHTISAPGLGVWRSSDPGVKTYRYLKQVTNLFAPAVYRAAVRFHWLNANGRLIRAAERNTPRCGQPAPPSTPSSISSVAGAGGSLE